MLKELRQKLAALIAEVRSILDKAKAEERGLTPDEQAECDAKETEMDSLEGQIKTEVRQIEREKNLNKPANKPAEIKPVKDPEEKRFDSFGEMLMAVVNAADPARRTDSRLVLETRAASGANEGVGSEGGFLVQQDFADELLKKAFETGVLASRVTKTPLSGNANSIKINALNDSSRATGSRWGGVQVYWASEAETVTAKKPTFRQAEMKLSKLMGLCYATDEMIEDAAALGSIIQQAFTEEFGFVIDDAIINGSGVGQPLGFMKSASLISVTRTTANATDYADIWSMYSRMFSRSKPNAVWLINDDIEPKLGAMLNGTYPAYMPPGGLSGAPYGTLFGKAVIPIEQAESVGTTGDISFVDLGQYAMIDKGGMKTASSLHVRFLYDEQVFKFTYRVDGQPKWNTVLTRYKGTTKSPFVVLSTKTS